VAIPMAAAGGSSKSKWWDKKDCYQTLIHIIQI
jgi:hypothetical protein